MTNRKFTNRHYLDALNERVLVLSGALGTSIQAYHLSAADFGGEKLWGCNDYLVISKPSVIEEITDSFYEVGSDIVDTATFRANRITLRDYGLQDRVVEINRTAAQLVRRVADRYTTPEKPRFVAGDIGPSGMLPSADDPTLSDITFDELVDVFREQASGLLEGGSDFLILETSQDILELRAAIMGLHKAFVETGIYVPVQAQVTLDTTGRMLLGTDIATALTILEGLDIDVVGMNCSTGPEHMRGPISYLGENATLPVSCVPNAGLPLNVDGEAVYPLEPEPFADALAEFVTKYNVSMVGGCCGSTPAHIKALVQRVGHLPHPPRPMLRVPRLASATQAVAMQQKPPPFIIGERCNAQGSRKFKRLLLAEDYDSILQVARQQVDRGAHALDISTAVTERGDEENLMRNVIKKLASGVEVPLVIDTTEPDVLEIALKTAPGRCLINSTHLEGGRAKADRVFSLAKAHNAAVICLTIDEQGMARTVERKLEVARCIYEIAVNEHGLRPTDLVFDDLTFTLATGETEYVDSAIETIEGIRRIKSALPGVLCSLGVSNLSFGLSANARPVLNSVMLYHCVQAGLDMAIVNPAHITAYADIPSNERELAEDLIFNRRADALQCYIEHFQNVVETSPTFVQVDPMDGMSPAERLHWCILHRRKDGVEADIDAVIKNLTANSFTDMDGDKEDNKGTAAVTILNTILLPAMKDVGDKFGAGELILPFILQSAEVMKKAVSHLETYLEKQDGVTKGTVVLATVYGDVHDIGKNLVKTILVNNGYTVIDLGKQVPVETIINKATEANATAIGLSALLVSTSKQMPLIVNELHRRQLKIPVLIGGAAINRRFSWRILYTEQGIPYEPGVFYCKDAFDGLTVMDSLVDSQRREELLKRIYTEAAHEMSRAKTPVARPVHVRHSSIVPSPYLPDSIVLGPRLVDEMSLEAVFGHLSLNELYRLSWGAKNTHGAEWEQLKTEFDRRLEQMKHQALLDGWLKPQGMYGFWPCQADGDDLILYNPANLADSLEPLARFSFPRQPSGDHLCLADYFAPLDSDKMDTVALQVVTVGREATERFEKLQGEGNYSEAYYLHGLAVQTAEAAAEYLHQHIRRELEIPAGQGKRYSWGYPAVPEMEDHRKVFDLLPVEKELGMSLSPAYQLIPEQSTAAIIIHHSQAKYYTVGESRVEQLMR